MTGAFPAADRDDGRTASRGQAWGVTATLWVLLVSTVAFEIVPASVLPLVVADLGVGPATASWLVSGVYLAMALFAIPAGLVIDRIDDRHAIAITTGWLAAGSGDVASLVASRFVAGGAVVAAWTASIAIVGDAFGGERQATGIGVFATGVPAGFAVAHFTGPALAAGLGWRTAVLVYPGVAVVATAGFWVVSRGLSSAGSGPAPAPREVARLLGRGPVLGLSALAFAAFSLTLFFTSWMPSFVVDRFAVPLAVGGLLAGLFPAVGMASRAASGLISNRLFGARRKPVVLLSFLVALPAVVGVGLVDSVLAMLLGLVVAGFATQLGQVLLFTYVRESVAPAVVGTALATVNAAGFLGGFSAPVVAGLLIERTGSYDAAFGYAGAVAVAAVVLAWAVPERRWPDRGP